MVDLIEDEPRGGQRGRRGHAHPGAEDDEAVGRPAAYHHMVMGPVAAAGPAIGGAIRIAAGAGVHQIRSSGSVMG